MFRALLFAAVCSFFLSVLGCLFLRRYASGIGFLDKPGHRKIHENPVPLGGGLAIWLAVVLPFAIGQLLVLVLLKNPDLISIPESLSLHLPGLWYRSSQLWMLLGLGSILVALGTLDDQFNLNWKIRMFVQFLVASAAVALGWKGSFFLDSNLFGSIVSVFWILGLTNSFNMLDNMNGLSSGVAVICSAFLAAVMFLVPNPISSEPQWFIAGFLFVLIGAISGFMLFNNPFRGAIFMGDGGAYFIGFLLACTTLSATFAGYGENSKQTIFVPICILAVPLYDTFSVIIIRLKNGRSPFEGDKSHYSHRLVELGLSPSYAVMTIYLTTTVCAIASILLYQVDFPGACLIMLQVSLILFLIAILETTGRRNK